MRILRMLPLFLLPLFLGLAGCEESATSPNIMQEAPATGVVAFRFSSAQVDTLAKEVDTLEVVLDNGSKQMTRRTRLATEVEFSDLPAGNWKLVVTLRRGGVAKYQGSTLVTITPGGMTDAKVVLSAVTGSLRVEIGFAKDGIASSRPTALARAWLLETFIQVDTLVTTPTLQLDSDGTAWIEGICGGQHKGSWMADDSLLWIEKGKATSDPKNCTIGTDTAVAIAKVEKLLGRPLRWKVRDASLVLSDAKSDTLLAVFTPFDPPSVIVPSPAEEVLGTWYLSELPGKVAVMDTIPLVLSENGTASGSDGCNYWSGKWSAPTDSTIKISFGATTLKACLDSTGKMLDKGYTKPLAGEVVWKVERLVGAQGDVRRLTLSNPKTGTVVGSYSTYPPFSRLVPVIPPILPAWESNPAALVGVWGLVSMPIEGLDTATGAMLVFDSLGRVSGNVACNNVNGSWKLDGDGKLVINGFASTFALCSDSLQNLVERGIHLMATIPLDWSIDSVSPVTGLEYVTVSSSITGAKAAVFALSRFGVLYASTPADTILVRPPTVRNPKFDGYEEATAAR